MSLKTLAEIWQEADRRPVDVIDGADEKYRLCGVDAFNAFLTSISAQGVICLRSASACQWKIYTEPKKPKRLWPAIVKMEGKYPYYFTSTLYESIDDAQRELVCDEVIRLATATDFAEGFLIDEEG
jgi:hypothetical protein